MYIVLALLAILVSSAFFTLDEETLIIICSFIWVDAAAGLFKNLLDNELLHKVDVIRSKFLWYLAVKRTFLIELLSFHRSRLRTTTFLVTLNSFLFKNLLAEILFSFFKNSLVKRSYNSYLWVLNFGGFVYYSRLVHRLDVTLATLPFSSTLVVKTNNFSAPSFNRYTALFPRFI